MTTQHSVAQAVFDNKYITAAQIMKDLNISRSGLQYARTIGRLPEPIIANDGRLFIWEREIVKPYLDAWLVALAARRGNQ